MSRNEIVEYTNKLLRISEFRDYCPNGLQVQGKAKVNNIVVGVTACQALIDAAIAAEADMLLVHHGLFWKGDDASLTGMKYERVKQLLAHDVNLLGYHLPLDAHPELGNNAELARLLNITMTAEMDTGPGPKFGFVGELDKAYSGDEFAQKIQQVLHHEVLHIAATREVVKTVAWCSGGAQSYFPQAIAAGVDAYLTGEASEQNCHQAKECNVHFYAAGHHATERYGVQALGEHLANQFNLDYQFIDIDNPI